MKKILVLGSAGMLGYGVSEYFKRKNYEVTALSRKEFDVIKSELKTLTPYIKNAELVINCIGIIKPMIELNTVIDVIKINGIFPRNLAKICNQENTKLIHVSTDCVFTGKKGKYNEEDFFDAEDLYGTSKNCGDINECLTVRTSFIGPEKETKRSLLEWAFTQKGKSINGFTNHLWNGVSTIYFAEIAEKIINDGLYREGILHLYSPDIVTKYELISLFNEVFNLRMTITPAEAAEFCDRSLESIHDITAKVSVKKVSQQIRELKDFFEL